MVFNILVVSGIKHSEIPDRSMGYYENRQVDIEVASGGFIKYGLPESIIESARYPNCKMKPRKNEGWEEKIKEWGSDPDPNKDEIPEIHRYATYFVKKRLTVSPMVRPQKKFDILPNRPIPQRFHFVATRNKIRDENEHIPGRSNEFKTQLGEIYCENSQFEGLHVDKFHKDCGIEQYLVGLCFFDGQVNSNMLKLDDVFSHYDQDEVNDPDNVRGKVESDCTHVVEFFSPGPSIGRVARSDAKKLLMTLKGARLAGYGALIWYNHPQDEDAGLECYDEFGWEWGSSTDLITKNEEDFFQFYTDTKKYSLWYFCSLKEGSDAMIS